MELHNYKIHLELYFSSDHTLLTVKIIIKKEFIPKKKYTIIKNSEDKSDFVKDFIRKFGSFDTVNITHSLKSIVQEYANIAELT